MCFVTIVALWMQVVLFGCQISGDLFRQKIKGQVGYIKNFGGFMGPVSNMNLTLKFSVELLRLFSSTGDVGRLRWGELIFKLSVLQNSLLCRRMFRR